MSQEQLQTIEIDIDKARGKVAMAECLIKLRKNRDFKRVIDEGYFANESQRVVQAKASPMALQDPVIMKDLDNQIIAIGYLRQYFLLTEHEGKMAKRSIAADMETREEILAEEE